MIEELKITVSDLVHAVYKKIRVLEIAEQAQIENNADGEK
jgi:hypothetical protein